VVQELGADICDINMGCPANKVLKGCSGAALMGDPKLAERIIKTCRDVLTIPLTVKFRLGLDDSRRNYIELGKICEANGVQAVAMHARTARQMFSGEADWSHLSRLKEALAIPVIGNGDVRQPEDAVRISGGAYSEPTLADRRDLILGHFRLVAERESSRWAMHKLRKFTGWYTH